MVGISRSKGCITCRKRKKACNQKRPECGQCGKLGVKCGGYVRELVFVNITKEPSDLVTVPVLPDTLARSAYENRYIGIFWTTYLPNGQVPSADELQSTLLRWTNTIQVLYQTNSTMKKAFLALCLASSGRLEGQEWMCKYGLRLYNSALHDMAMALKRPPNTKMDSILATAKLLGLYEALYGANDTDELTQAKRCMVHLSGELAILVARGPDEYIGGNAHELFVHGRLGLITSAIRARKKSILSLPAWRTIPWSHCAKTEKDKLLDILAEMPTLLEEFDILNSQDNLERKELHRQRLIDKCWVCDQQLAEWYARLPQFFDEPACHSTGGMPPAFAHLMTLYWSTCIILYSVMHKIAGPGMQLLHHMNLKTYCRNIIRTVPVLFHPAVGICGANLAIFPMNVVMTHLDIFGPEERVVEGRLLQDILKKPEVVTIGKLLKSLDVIYKA